MEGEQPTQFVPLFLQPFSSYCFLFLLLLLLLLFLLPLALEAARLSSALQAPARPGAAAGCTAAGELAVGRPAPSSAVCRLESPR